ncbi:MAG: hypothetical protein KF690_01175 [Bacteroidetes bacterium]|nr:hypothetical protein [Bacteroidota bacterium]
MRRIHRYIFFVSIAVVAALGTPPVRAQQQTYSPYSEYGVGELNTPAMSRYFGMYGLGVAAGDPYSVNYQNPASWGQVRTTTLDFSLQARNTRLSTAQTSIPFGSGGLNALAFVFTKPRSNFGVSAGLLPYSSVGYEVRRVITVPNDTTTANMVSHHEGQGGLNTFYLGAGGKLRNLPIYVGGSLNYLFGTVRNTYTSGFATTVSASNPLGITPTTRTEVHRTISYQGLSARAGIIYRDTLFRTHIPAPDSTSSARERARYQRRKVEQNAPNFLRVGLIWEQPVWGRSERDLIVVGSSGGSLYNAVDTLDRSPQVSVSLPFTAGMGICLERELRYLIGLDITYQNWSTFALDGENQHLQNLLRLSLGGEWIPNRNPTNLNAPFLSRIAWRAGTGYEQSYLRLNGQAITAYGASVGMGIPISKLSSNRINLGLQWQRRGTTENNLVREDNVRFLLGISFSELWYSPRKYQ